MPGFDVDRERINVFPIDNDYLFKHYFDRQDIFDELQDFYNAAKYRFEVPQDEFEAVQDLLVENYYEPVVVDDFEAYCVVKEKYTDHADILRQSVAHWERRGQMFFLMKNELAVKEAIEHGATPIHETDYVVGL